MPTRERWRDPLIALAIFLLCLFLYNATLTPSLSYASPDGNELTTVAATLGLAHPTGYPLFTWLGFLFARLLPFGDVAHRTNLMSAILGAGGVAILFLIARQVALTRAVAAFAALLFGVSTTFWSQAVITEVYAPNVFILALTVWLLLKAEGGRRKDETELRESTIHPSAFSPHPFVLFAFVFGLSPGMHMSNLGFAPAFALFILLTDWRVITRPLTILAALAAFLLGLAQFAWLPLRAPTASDPLALAFAPNTLRGFYVYTVGAFSNLRFAFPITALPDRVVIYFSYLLQNFTVVGVALGLLGMWVLLARHPKRFWLFIGMYCINVFFFAQYRAFDLDVFFIPSHFVFAIFAGFGAQQLLDWLRGALARVMSSQRAIAFAITLALVAFFFFPVAALAANNFKANNRTTDTAIPDFYANVYAMLPPNSALVTRRGVFGYDAFYWRAVYNVRPDVIVPMERGSTLPPSDAPLFTTLRMESGQVRGAGLWAPPRGMLPEDAWYVPVLVGSGRDLVLYRASDSLTPPQLVVANAQPQTRIDRAFDGLTLVGVDLARVPDAPKPRVHLKTYWRITQPRAYLISTQVDDITLETHDLGFGNLARYAREHSLTPRDGVVVEEFDLALPSYLKRGAHALKIGLAQFTGSGVTMQWVNVGNVEVK
jgi:hypothetical protein